MSAELIRDEWDWWYQAPTGSAVRRLRVWRTEPRRLVAVVTEEGAGMSVTNAAAIVVRQLEAEYPDDIVEVIEHYPAAGAGTENWAAEHFDAVWLDEHGEPAWRRVSIPDLVDRLGPRLLD